MRKFRIKRRLIIGIICSVGFVFAILQVFLLFSKGNFEENLVFEQEPFLNSYNEIEFTINCDMKHLFFKFIGPFAKGSGFVSKFCDNSTCYIPNVIVGRVNFILEYREHTEEDIKTKFLYRERVLEISNSIFDIKKGQINCTDEPWTNRICTFRNICYSIRQVPSEREGNVEGSPAVEMFTVLTPYNVEFEDKMLVLGGKTPPVDLEMMRIINKINSSIKGTKSSESFNTARRYTAPGQMVGIYYNMQMMWHQIYDIMLPLYLTLTRETGYVDQRTLLLYQPFVPQLPLFLNALTMSLPVKLDDNTCFDKMTMGMVKITNLTKDTEDPPYEFPQNCTTGLREIVLKNIGRIKIKEGNQDYDSKDKIEKIKESNKPLVVVLGRRTKVRSFNEETVKKVFENILPDYEVEVLHFEDIPLSSQIEVISKATVFVSIHGSGLSHIIWMKHGSYAIEIMPYKYDCNDWYKKASGAVGVNYFAYHSDGDSEHPSKLSDGLLKCISEKEKCGTKFCKDTLRDQNVTVDPERFKQHITGFLSDIIHT